MGNAPAGNHGSCIHHLGLNICFDEYSYMAMIPSRLVS